jgi:anti-sigma B factor antagonist
MNLIVEKAGEVTLVEIVSENLDASNERGFKQDMAPVLESDLRVALDLSQLQFVDSSGLGAILACLRRVNARGGDLKLYGMTRPVRALFELVRMHRVFEIYNSRDEVVESFE